MPSFSIRRMAVLAFALAVAVFGCTQQPRESRDAALTRYNAEIAALERSEKELAELEAKYKEVLGLIEQSDAIERGQGVPYEQRKARKLSDEAISTFSGRRVKLKADIEAQTARVDEAKAKLDGAE